MFHNINADIIRALLLPGPFPSIGRWLSPLLLCGNKDSVTSLVYFLQLTQNFEVKPTLPAVDCLSQGSLILKVVIYLGILSVKAIETLRGSCLAVHRWPSDTYRKPDLGCPNSLWNPQSFLGMLSPRCHARWWTADLRHAKVCLRCRSQLQPSSPTLPCK